MEMEVNLTWQRSAVTKWTKWWKQVTLCCCRCSSRYDRPETPRCFLYTQFKMAAHAARGVTYIAAGYIIDQLFGSFIYIFYSSERENAAGCCMPIGRCSTSNRFPCDWTICSGFACQSCAQEFSFFASRGLMLHWKRLAFHLIAHNLSHVKALFYTQRQSSSSETSLTYLQTLQ